MRKMTREEAIRIFRKEIECLSHTKCSDCRLEKVCDPINTTPLDSEYIEAFGMAIKALEQEPCEDAISRNMALSEVKSGMIRTIDGENWKRVNDNVRDILALPSVTPKQRTGRWIDEGFYAEGHSEHAYRCSECDEHYIGYVGEHKYCPNCGVKMEESEGKE